MEVNPYSLNYYFNAGVAQKVGSDGAVILNNFHFWITKNMANNKHFHEGKYWTYNSQEAFTKLFPYLTKKQIRRILDNLKKEGYIETGNFNKVAYDRTTWYTLTEKGWQLICPSGQMSNANICPNGQMEKPEWANGNDQMDQPIPDNKPNQKPEERKKEGKKKEESYNDIISSYTENEDLKDALIEFTKMRKNIKSPMTNRALKLLLTSLDKLSTNETTKIDILNQSILNNWKGVFPLKDNMPKANNNIPKYDKNGFEIDY